MTKSAQMKQHETTELAVLLAILRLRRPYNSANELLAREIIIQHLTGAVPGGFQHSVDRHGNLVIKVGADSGVVFTAHLDTVHNREGINNVVMVKPNSNERWLVADDENSMPDVLGADDAAGIFLLTELIKAGVPATYLFFVGEEVGGVGSSAFVRDNPTFSANMAIAFDRRGYQDVITHQGWGGRTASDEFGAALADALNQHMPSTALAYVPSSRGVYTDTKEFAGIVPECTNISVGYFNEHTNREELDLNHLLALRDAVLAIEWHKLPVMRVPEAEEDYLQSFYTNRDVVYDPYIPLSERATTLLNTHYATLHPDVASFLRELEDMFDA